MILMMRTDSSDVYLGLWQDGKEQMGDSRQAGRELSGQILQVITAICKKVAISTSQISGIVIYEGPGSYTGLRIGMSVANPLGSSYNIPLIGVSSKDWQQEGLEKLQTADNFMPVSPVYGGEVYTTKPRK